MGDGLRLAQRRQRCQFLPITTTLDVAPCGCVVLLSQHRTPPERGGCRRGVPHRKRPPHRHGQGPDMPRGPGRGQIRPYFGDLEVSRASRGSRPLNPQHMCVFLQGIRYSSYRALCTVPRGSSSTKRTSLKVGVEQQSESFRSIVRSSTYSKSHSSFLLCPSPIIHHLNITQHWYSDNATNGITC